MTLTLNRRRVAIGLLGIVLVLLLLPSPFRPKYALVGKPAPAFELRKIGGGGGSFASKEMLGKVVLLEFVGTWSPPCEGELHVAEEASRHVAGSMVIGIDTSDDAAAAEAWLGTHPQSFPLLFDEDNRVSRQFVAFEVPTQIIIAPNGTVAAVHEGLSDPKELEAWMKKAR